MANSHHESSPAPEYAYGDGEVQESSIDFARILDAIKKHFWVILLYLVAGTIGAIAYLNLATPIYQSYAMVKVEQRVLDSAPTLMTTTQVEDLRSLEMVGTIQRSFLSRSLMERIVEKLRLNDRKDFLPSTVPADEVEEKTIKFITENTSAEIVRGTRLISISFEHPNRDVARDVTDALIREFIALDAEQRLQSAGSSISYLMEEKKSLEKRLRDSEEKLSQYTQKLGSVSVDNELNIIAEQLKELNSRLTVAKADRLKLAADFEQIQEVQNDPAALLQIVSIAELPEIQNLKSQLNQADAEVSKMMKRYGALSPQIAELKGQRDTIKESLQAEALHAPRMVEISLRAATQNEKGLERETKSQELKTLDVKQLAIQSSVLERQIEADKLAYQATLVKYNEEASTARSQPIFLQVVDSASPAYKVKPRPVVVIAIAVFLSLALAGGTIVLLAVLDTSIKSVEEAERVLGVPVLAAVPMLSTGGTRRGKNPPAKEQADFEFRMPLLEDQHSTVSEAFRTLRASLRLADEEKQLSVLITSATPGEGKSFCAMNLCVALAQQDMQTLLIDADLRKPVIEARMFGTTEQVGLSDFLTGRADIDQIVRETRVPGLSVITAGRTYQNPAELLSRTERVSALLALVEGRFDRIVVDSAPVLAVSDTLSLARLFRTITLVVRSHKTGRRYSRRAIDLLARTGHPVWGVTMNMVPVRGASYYYYHYSKTGGAYGARPHGELASLDRG